MPHTIRLIPAKRRPKTSFFGILYKINIPANKKSDERNNRTDITEIIR